MEPPRTISLSQVNSYLACPLKYRFQYVDKIPRPWRVAVMAFGSSIHAAVEWFHKQRIAGVEPSLEAVQEIFAADWYAQNTEPLVFSERESRDGLLEKGREMLSLYVARSGETRAIAAEEFFEIELCDPETGEAFNLTLRGVIDLVEEGETVADLKTASRTLEEGGLERHLQLSTYALAWFLRTGRIPALRLDMLLKTKTPRLERLSTSRTLPELAWTAQLIHEVALSIETEHFFPNPSWRCSECEYFAHCQRWRGYEPPADEHLVAVEVSGGGVGDAAA